MIRPLFAALAAALLLAAPVAAQDDPLAAAEAAVAAAWAGTPLTIRNVKFATEITSYGIYAEKQGAVFAPGEPIIVYGEPVGYGYRDNGDGTWSFGFSFDYVVKSIDGDILGGKEGFQTYESTSHQQNREFLLNLTLALSGAQPGSYVLEYVAHDIASDETATITLPFSISE